MELEAGTIIQVVDRSARVIRHDNAGTWCQFSEPLNDGEKEAIRSRASFGFQGQPGEWEMNYFSPFVLSGPDSAYEINSAPRRHGAPQTKIRPAR